MSHTIAIFGEAEKGKVQYPYFFRSLKEMAYILGNPPENTQGLHFAVQALLYQRELIYFRVNEEGFTIKDYEIGLSLLEKDNNLKKLSAICLPGVGDEKIINTATVLQKKYNSILIVTEKDLYDYITAIQHL